MATMVIEVPDGRPVHVFVGEVGCAIAPERAQIADDRAAAPRRRRPLLTLAGGVAVLALGFILGQHTITSHAQAEPETASAVTPAPPPVQQAFPAQAPAPPAPAPAAAALSGQMPPALAQQLQQPPQVVPPPGQPPAGSQSEQNAFGLGG